MSASETTTGQEWYAEGLRFECTRCGRCCTGAPGYVAFTQAELETMARSLGITAAEFLRRYARKRNGGWSLREVKVGDDHDCILLRREPGTGLALCAVYRNRPAQCRSWPFWPENLESRSTWDDAALECPGMRVSPPGGRLYPVEEIRVLRDTE